MCWQHSQRRLCDNRSLHFRQHVNLFFRVIFNYLLSKNKDGNENKPAPHRLHQLWRFFWWSRVYLQTIDSRFIEVTQLTQLSHIFLSFLALSPSHWKWKSDPCPNNRTTIDTGSARNKKRNMKLETCLTSCHEAVLKFFSSVLCTFSRSVFVFRHLLNLIIMTIPRKKTVK